MGGWVGGGGGSIIGWDWDGGERGVTCVHGPHSIPRADDHSSPTFWFSFFVINLYSLGFRFGKIAYVPV